jgi:hypothetical protein
MNAAGVTMTLIIKKICHRVNCGSNIVTLYERGGETL